VGGWDNLFPQKKTTSKVLGRERRDTQPKPTSRESERDCGLDKRGSLGDPGEEGGKRGEGQRRERQ